MNTASNEKNTLQQTISSLESEIDRLKLAQMGHVRILHALDDINKIIMDSIDQDEMLERALQAFLRLFSCDRAWLLFPCSIKASITTVPMECTVPAWPGAETDGLEIPIDDVSREIFKKALQSSSPVRYDPEENPLDPNYIINQQFHIKSQLVMAIHPKVGDPWLLGIHHCSAPIIYNENDCALFEALGNRLSDALTSLISQQNTKKLFNSAEVSIWNEDLTEIYYALEKLRKDGITDLRGYLENNDQVVRNLANSREILQVNDATLKLFDAKNEADFFQHIGETFGLQMIDVFIDELCAMWNKEDLFRSEAAYRSLNDKHIDAIITLRLPKSAKDYKAVAVSIIDITERKKAETALHIALQEADRSNQVKSQFLESMSHELRTPLNAILGFAQIMQINKKSPLTPEQYEHVECILSGGNHLLDLVNEILDLAKIEANQLDLALEDVNVYDVISECLTLIAPLGEQRSIIIINEYNQPKDIILHTDKLRFKQALINLLSNAIKYNKDDGTVHVQSEITDKGFLRISVIDTGIGIHIKDRDKVFQMFHRIGADAMKSREGTGIGLTVTKLLIERMAGFIGFESTLGTGSRFWIELPLASNNKVLVWNDSMRVGVDSIDRDHQYLVSLLNSITHEDFDARRLDTFFEELSAYTKYHFHREEVVMEACNYPNLDRHLLHHQDFVLQLKDRQNNWYLTKNNNPDFIPRFQEETRVWLYNQILANDVDLAKYTKGKEQEIRQALEAMAKPESKFINMI
ncbi:MAG: ATP-binding protein [Halopseudomonas aestusnigri]